MTKVVISPVHSESDRAFFNAVVGNKCARGRTAGEALDALSEQLDKNEGTMLVVLQNLRPSKGELVNIKT